MTGSMESYLELALATPLFSGFGRADAAELIRSLSGDISEYAAGAVIIPAGVPASKPACIVLVLSGQVRHIYYDPWEDQSMVDYTGAGGVFGWAQAFGGEREFQNAAVAGTDCALLRLFLPDTGRTDRNGILFERNLLKNIAKKSVSLERKVNILSQRSVRERLLIYLQYESKDHGKNAFQIPLNRQALADYLHVDRTTLSTELGRMRQDGLIDFDRNFFVLQSGNTDPGRGSNGRT